MDRLNRNANGMRTRNQKDRSLSIGAYNTRGLRNSLEEIGKIVEELDALFISETWMKSSDTDISQMVDELVYANSHIAMKRAYGGMAVIIRPLLRYELVGKFFTERIQAITVLVSGVTITGIYISPNAKEDEELQALEKIKAISKGSAIIIRDMNARHEAWDSKTNGRGRRIS